MASTPFDTGHLDLVHDAQFDFYAKRVATCSSDRLVKVFRVEAGAAGEDCYVQTGEIAAHEGPVWQVAWAHPQFGSLLATCGYDRRVMVFRESSMPAPGNWVRVFCYEAHESSGACAARRGGKLRCCGSLPPSASPPSPLLPAQ